jgi:catechol 2,3-dioxygenase-like lactoylglutathione lyase family enzyme
MAVATPFYDRLLPILGFSKESRTSAVIDKHDLFVIEYRHERLCFALSSPRTAFRRETVHRRRPGALHHLAFRADSRAEVDRLHDEIKATGAAIVAPPREYPEYTPPGYYAFFFKDPDGIKYEVVAHAGARASDVA